MRTVGVVCLALGTISLVMSAFPISMAENSTQLYFGLGCAGFVGFPLCVLGIFITRREARKLGPEGEAEASAKMLERSQRVASALSRGGQRMFPVNPRGNALDRLQAFDLNSLTVAGWLLILASIGIVIGTVVLILKVVLADMKEDLGPLNALFFFGGIILFGLSFFIGRLILGAYGVAVTADPNPGPRRKRTRSSGDASDKAKP
jgi:amino acid transporter